MRREGQIVTKTAVARRAGVSVAFLRSHADLVQRVEEAEVVQRASPRVCVLSETTKDQVIASLRRRLGEMKRELAARDDIIREKQREINRLYGKLASSLGRTRGGMRD